MKTTRSAGGVVLNSRGQVLIVSQHGSSWSLPKGHLDPGEDALAAARREIYEESGVQELDLIQSLGTYERHRIGKEGGEDIRELKIITVFLFKTNQTRLKPIDKDNPEALWVEKEKVVDLLTHLKDKEFFKSIIDKL